MADRWKLVRSKIHGGKATTDPPLSRLEREALAHAKKLPKSSQHSTATWVARKSISIQNTPSAVIPEDEPRNVMHLVNKFLPLIDFQIHRWKPSVGVGPDGVNAPRLKRAPKSFRVALAFFLAWCCEACIFPPLLRLGLAKYIPKSKGKWRGIRLESLLAKIAEVCVLDPIFPAFGLTSPLIANEHMAGKRGLSAEMAAASFSITLDLNAKDPLYIFFADVHGAYDHLWKEATWAKLHDAHRERIEVKRAAAIFKHFVSKIPELKKGSLIRSRMGVPQGGPRSLDLFCFFTSDLPEELRAAGAGVIFHSFMLVCLVYLDDWAVFLRTEKALRNALDTMSKYGDRWSMSWSLPKLGVMCINVKKPPTEWQFGRHFVPTIQSEKWLSVHFTSNRRWNAHYTEKLRIAKFMLLNLRRAGLLGGHNALSISLDVVQRTVWSSLDYGRAATNSELRFHKATRSDLARFQNNTLREVLSVSGSASIDGLFGETGDTPDLWRERHKALAMCHLLSMAPEDSIPAQLARLSSEYKVGLMQRGREITTMINLPWSVLSSKNASTKIKRALDAQVRKEWQARVMQNGRLRATYHSQRDSPRLRGYLRHTFKGRQILLKLRIDDLPLGAAGSGIFGPPIRCELCGRDAETRQHFVLTCAALQSTRARFLDFFDRYPPRTRNEDILRDILLTSHPNAADNLQQAMIRGEYLFDMYRDRLLQLGQIHRMPYP